MLNVNIENIIAFSKIATNINIEKLSQESPEFIYNREDFLGLTLKLNNPRIALLIFQNGKVIFTGAKKFKDIEKSLKIIIDKLKRNNIKIKTKPKIIYKNIIVSYNFGKKLNLDSISKNLLLENLSYKPEEFSGLIYKINDIGAVVIIFSSGKVVCTGADNVENSSKGIEIIKEKLSLIEAL